MTIIFGQTIGMGSLIIGAVAAIVAYIVFRIINKLINPRPKIDLYNLKKLVYDGGVKSKEVYESFKKLEEIFKEMENVKR